MTIQQYIDNLNKRYKAGISREHSYRGDLQSLISALATGILVTNEPARIACGAPDYIITRKNIPVGYIEAKDIGADLNSKNYREQFDRYRQSLGNLIITDYLTFQLYRDGSFVTSISIGQISGQKVIGKKETFSEFTELIKGFCSYKGQTIKSASKLSKMMAAKARLMANVIEKALLPDENNNDYSSVNETADNTLFAQYKSFQQVLIHDITEKGFADIYAQTIAYGMFAARLHDDTLEDFSRQEAAELIPKSNPFLRKLFQYIAGYDLDDRIKWIVDALADVFCSTNVAELLKDFGKATQQDDPIIHFYETFLTEYDPALRKSRGVWYTPKPVVNFIVRAIDDILKTEFDLPMGLADTSKTKIKVDYHGKKIDKEVHKVQLLDPATGTGTFIAEVFKHIHKQFEGQQGIWSSYVDEHLIPRLNGFELLMASYAMAHLKLDLLLRETGYKPTKEQRFRIYLTNSLEEHHHDTGTLFANWLSTEASEANLVKKDTPVMCVFGNPPYSVSSTNKGEWIESLLKDYKKDLKERNIQPLSDDYIKFIRYGQYYIDKNGSGVLAYISNNSFIDGIIHRQMRKNLLQSFDKIYILDLHGSAKKNEVSLDGGKDENVFDIQQGVSISFFVKTGKKKKNELAEVFHNNLFGAREFKYGELNQNTIGKLCWEKLDCISPNYFFTRKNFSGIEEYNKGFSLDKLFSLNASGIKTQRDDASIKLTEVECKDIKKDFLNLSNNELIEKYGFKDVRDWKIDYAKNDLSNNPILSKKLLYRPFDFRCMNYTGKTKGIMGYPRFEVMRHLLKNNYALLTCRQQSTFNFQHIFVSKHIADMCSISLQTKETGYVFPLYFYPESSRQQNLELTQERIPNLKREVIQQISKEIQLTFTIEKEETKNSFAPIDILDYIYAVLHSPSYREKYKEFLKIDFPRVPYPTDQDTFWQLVKLGGELRQIHLLESPVVNDRITTYPVPGSNEVDKPKFDNGRVYINKEQYFEGVPLVAWEFYIGGYQPAQKWLKDRKNRELSFEDILHYQKIIVALAETNRLMKEIDKIDFE